MVTPTILSATTLRIAIVDDTTVSVHHALCKQRAPATPTLRVRNGDTCVGIGVPQALVCFGYPLVFKLPGVVNSEVEGDSG